MVRAGLTPYQALRSATAGPAEFFGAEAEFGTVSVGRRADLVLLDADPLVDVSRTRQIAGVMLRGRWMPRAELDRRREELAAVYRGERSRFAGRPPLSGGPTVFRAGFRDVEGAMVVGEERLAVTRRPDGTRTVSGRTVPVCPRHLREEVDGRARRGRLAGSDRQRGPQRIGQHAPSAIYFRRDGDMEEDFTGIELARLFYREAVAPIVDRVFPGLPYTAGLLGDCSDVIGLDDAISRDHGWGPRCQLLLPAAGFADTRRALHVALADGLPLRFRGYSTSFGDASQGWRRVDVHGPPVRHWVDMATPESFLEAELGIRAATSLTARDWLAMRSDKLLGVTAGALFRDDLRFDDARRALAFYPEDVRLYLIAAEWMKIADEQAFPGRAGSCGDEVGSAIIAARLAEGLMRLCFHLEREYAPYSKWFGSAFARLPGCAGVRGPIASMLTAAGWKDRDRHWTDALIAVIGLHEREGLLVAGRYRPAPVYLGRPGTGLRQFGPDPPSIASLIDDIRDRIADREVRALAAALQPA